MRTVLFLFPACLAASVCTAQPPNGSCGTAALLCAQQPLTGDNTGAPGAPAPICPGTANALWYSFTTNSRGGPVQVRVTDIDCPAVAGMGNALNVVVLGSNTGCGSSWTAMSACVSDTAEATVTTQALMPGTRYWVVVSGATGGGTATAAQCGFGLVIDGPGADIVGVDFSAGEDVTIGPEESIRLSGFGGPPYDWSPTAGLSNNGIPDPIASPIETTVYTLTTTRIDGCEFSDQVTVNVVRRIDPPNTITPNGDGINDVWEVPGIADYPGAEVTIYDRWGQVVYRSTGYREPWDGTNGGKPLSVGTYYYHIQLNQLEGRGPPYTGFISIVR